LKQRLEEILDEKTNGIIFRSKARWYEQGEKCTKYFFNLEKRNYQRKTVRKLVTSKGEVMKNPKEIQKEQRLFYQNLYSSVKQDSEEIKDLESKFLESPTLPKLSPDDRQSCEG
jgi:hypothetical protein